MSVEAVFRQERGRALATLIRLLGDFDRAEEALQEAFLAALASWPREGAPRQPRRPTGRRSPRSTPSSCASILRRSSP